MEGLENNTNLVPENNDNNAAPEVNDKPAEPTFTQAEVNSIIEKRLARRELNLTSSLRLKLVKLRDWLS